MQRQDEQETERHSELIKGPFEYSLVQRKVEGCYCWVRNFDGWLLWVAVCQLIEAIG